MEKILFSPPVAFMILFFAAAVLFWSCSLYAFRKTKKSAGAEKAYACGENLQDAMIQPDYSQFFPFAFFFTILHVVALVIATVPAATAAILLMAGVYITGAIIGLIVLLRR